MGWDTYNEILRDENGSGRLLLGQIPIDSFNKDLLSELIPNGLVVSCNDCFELAGCGTPFEVTAPFLWCQAGISHHHLPFTDYSDNASPILVLETLQKMMSVYQAGGTVYVHCKAGRSRSALVVVLFLAIQRVGEQKNISPEELRQIFIDCSNVVKRQRPQISLDRDKTELGLQVLRLYYQQILDLDRVTESPQSYLQSVELLGYLSQSLEFKGLWHFAYKHNQYFNEVKLVMDLLYEDTANVLATLRAEHSANSQLAQACRKIKENESGQIVLNALMHFLEKNEHSCALAEVPETEQAFQRFNKVLLSYKEQPEVIKAARSLQSEIFLSSATEVDKSRWLNEASTFLESPNEFAESYFQQLNYTFESDETIKNVGKGMMILGIAVLVTAAISAMVAASLMVLPLAATIGLAGLVCGILLVCSASEDKVGKQAHSLIEAVTPGL
ncbi:hypothetical protein Lbru_3171 [Legionella brunensis]|uniref:Tyrosine specific protein phosphatases domain-containing protein n=1 Tax=Legionella brunensis TaxID=29422 RepID=A0A0W0S153_9GAMM|nr:hypothetical protein Lbru_3171 [Legionella brunensis]